MAKTHLLIAAGVGLLSVLSMGTLPPAASAGEGPAAPNDPLFPKQEKMFEILEVLEAWRLTKGSPEVLVGVIDSGFDFFHPDLKGRVLPGQYASGGFHSEVLENVAHGTLVSSIIAAKANNGEGMAGLAPACRVLTVSHGMIEHKLLCLQKAFFEKNPKADMKAWRAEMMRNMKEIRAFGRDWLRHVSTTVSEGIRFLTDRGAKVINLSVYLDKRVMASMDAKKRLDDAFRYAAEHDVVIVLGAGNNGVLSEDYPGDEASTLVAGAVLLDDTRWAEERTIRGQVIKQGSNFGKRLSVMAPVQNIVVCMPHDKRFYASLDGPTGVSKSKFEDRYRVHPMGATSSATPVVSSLVALVRSLRPDLDAKTVVAIVKKGADDIGERGFDEFTGHGRVNFRKTLEIAKAWGGGREEDF